MVMASRTEVFELIVKIKVKINKKKYPHIIDDC